ncbi:MAG: Asp-tRNA(Asn)/Glu-tRNA(Gln) amidotransferase subunit GatA [Alphaproteobacteria bacterium]|nr:Asp-tRNA(Asn)/Glu-tRNA(Gln) amidotransferase subunit GatA [Alphaproteobacteria bacterium]MBU0795816.1 Asp-tRNA(Asn)/Glu-tRNA(Gln) amidotransferase subunit GatA [Alphaproteobacteria bacterium]MBU0886678.1 Asp-tRNA(Asn)/Glu-tRNA(Gln) amidotransferase subunit GatA [Alphaproteobacteria bacterium]MBU1814533.1 Asp-tRNA(Asn)/Glu-tRNA(Gln) amidotransferase subunit GatA [Alphaproteobacteria bacterium]
MTSLTGLTMAAALDGLAKKEFSSAELTAAYVKAMEQARHLNAYVTETPDQALAMAQASDARRAKGEAGAMDGVPLGVKDLYCTKGVLTTAGSHILDGFTPTYESTVTQKLWDAGAVMLGKTNLDEFAMGSANITSYYGKVESPWRKAGDNRPLVPGGSSGGSAAAVAAHAAIAATGTDTGGSIRQPAAYTGIVGLKPTYGRCSRWGIIAYASSLDQAGPMTRDVTDAAIMMGVMAGFDAKDSTSVDIAVPDYRAALEGSVKGLRVGIPKEYRVEGMPAEIEQQWQQGIEWLKAAGMEPVEVSLPHTQHALATYYIIAPAEASSNLARYDGVRYGLRVEGDSLDKLYENSRAAGFGAEVKLRVLIGTYVLSAGYYDAYYLKAQKIRTLIAEDFRKAYEQCDVILTPTSPSAAFAIGEKMDDPVAMYMQDVFTVPANLAGIPGLAVPAGLSADGLPLGLQVLGKAFDEETVLKVGRVIEKAAAFSARPSFLAGE